jgi:hypothetical protein
VIARPKIDASTRSWELNRVTESRIKTEIENHTRDWKRNPTSTPDAGTQNTKQCQIEISCERKNVLANKQQLAVIKGIKTEIKHMCKLEASTPTAQ